MRTSLFMVLLSLFPANTSRAQESAGTPPESTQAVLPRQQAPVVQQEPFAKSETFKEKHHRVFWVSPTYTVVESKSASPLTTRGKWQVFMKDKTDPFTLGSIAFEAGLAQANNDFPGYGQGAAGYGKRLGAELADQTATGFFGCFLFASVFHQDPRYYRLGDGSFKRRLGHALIRPILTQKDSGERAFNWAGILGITAASSLSNFYYPEGYRGAGATFSRIGTGIPFSMMDKVFNEFGPDLQKRIFRKK